MAITIMQGDSYPIFLNLTQDGMVLSPDLLSDLEVYVGENLRLTYVEGTVMFDPSSNRWYIWPTQEQTFALEEGGNKVEARPKYKNENKTYVKGFKFTDKIKVIGAKSREVL